jgi:hypothetical protein
MLCPVELRARAANPNQFAMYFQPRAACPACGQPNADLSVTWVKRRFAAFGYWSEARSPMIGACRRRARRRPFDTAQSDSRLELAQRPSRREG